MEQTFFHNQTIDSLINSLPDAVFIGNSQGIKRANDQALKMMGLSSEREIPHTLTSFIKAFNFRFIDTQKPVLEGDDPLSQALNGQRTVTELQLTNHETGQQVYSRCAAAPVWEKNKVIGGLLVLTDITERVLAERKLHETLHALSTSTREQEAILNSIPDGVYIGNEKGVYKANTPGLEMLGCSSLKELQGNVALLSDKINLRYADTGERVPSLQDPFSRALQGERVVQEYMITQFKTGKNVYLRSAAAPVMLNNKIIAALVVNTDITQKIKAEHKLQATLQELKKVNEELEAFTYAVSHDLKSPLGRINGLASLLLISSESQITEKDRYLLQLIVQSSDKLTELVNHLLNLGKIGQTELSYSKVNLTQVCEQALENLPQSKKKIKFHIDPHMEVWGDKTLLHSVMQNLLANAVKYSSKNPDPEVTVAAHEAEGQTICFVRDNGVGFDMSEADKLFLPFKRLYTGTNFEGTGVGLSTVKRIIERHEGKIWAEAKPGEGATFYFSLPSRKKGNGNRPKAALKMPESKLNNKLSA